MDILFKFSFQLNDKGELIPKEEQKFVFMVPYLKSMQCASNDSCVKEFLRYYPVSFETPVKSFSWSKFITEAKVFFGKNFFAFLMYFAGAVTAFHYRDVLSVIGMLYVHYCFYVCCAAMYKCFGSLTLGLASLFS